MNKAIGLALLAVGIGLLIYGSQSSNSFSSGVSRAFTGSPTNKTLWLLLGGVAATITGAVLALLPARKV